MPNMLFANNANTTLASSLTAGATSMSVTSATGFPSPTGVQYFYCTLADAATQTTIEIVKVTSVSGTTFAITRAQDGTSATAFAAGAVVSLRLVRASLNDFPKLDETNTFNADQSITGQLTTSAGMATTGQFTATAPSNGVVTDVISGYGRFSTFSSNGFQWFTGGIGTTKLMQLSSSGVITTATWNGATVGVAYGGTGVTSATGTGAGASVVLSQAPAINSPVITAYSTSTVPLKVYGLSGQITELFDVYTYNGGTLAFQINSSGAITTGTWNGATVGTGYGGTGLTSFTSGGVVYASSTSALTTGSALQFDGTNLGIGVTPSAWFSNRRAIQIASTGSSIAAYTGSGLTEIRNNTYLNSGGSEIYVATGYALKYLQNNDQHQWYSAVSGTAGGTATFTQAMTLDNSGNLLVGGTTNTYGAKLLTQIGSGTNWMVGPLSSQTTRWYVLNGGGTGVYLVDGQTSWTANSDERLKTDLLPITDAANKVLTLRAVTGRYKTDKEGTSRAFLIAQDVQKVLPEAVSDSDPDALGVQYTDVIPLLVAAINELNIKLNEQMNLINSLQSKIGI